VLVNYIREFQLSRGVPAAEAYNVTMYVLVGLLAIGLLCNLAVRRVPDNLFVALAAAGPSAPTGHSALGQAAVDGAGSGCRFCGVVARRPAARVGCVQNAWLSDADVSLTTEPV